MKLKSFILLAAITLFSGTAVVAQEKEFVGYQHRGVVYGARLPNGAKDLGGGLLSDENYGVSRFSKNGRMMLWLEKIISIEKDGVPRWEVKDVIALGKPKKSREILFSYTSPCTENGAENLDLIVLAKSDRKKKTYKVLEAWRANLDNEVFEKISTENIVCEIAES
jgi:hypothetical protein